MTVGVIFLWRVLLSLPVAGIDPAVMMRSVGGRLPVLQEVPATELYLGFTPFVVAWIVAQLLTLAVPAEVIGPGRLFLGIRIGSVLLGVLQAISLVRFWSGASGAAPLLIPGSEIGASVQLATGVLLLIWLGDILDEHGLGDGQGIWLLFAVDGTVRGAGLFLSDYLYLPASVANAALVAWVGGLVVTAALATLLVVGRAQLAAGRSQHPLVVSPLFAGVALPGVLSMLALSIPFYSAQLILGPHFQSSGVETWLVQNWRGSGPLIPADLAYLFAGAITAVLVTMLAGVVELNRRGVGNARLRRRALRTACGAGVGLAIATFVIPAVMGVIARGTVFPGLSLYLLAALIADRARAFAPSGRGGRLQVA